LCGDNVRYDGHSKGFPALISALEPYLDLQKICPEVAIGMGTPRAPIQLCNDSGSIRAIGIKNPQHDVTEPLTEYAGKLSSSGLCGYIFKSRSPSCGVGSTPIHENNSPVALGDGVFAYQIQQHLPWLPVTEEAELINSHQQQHFVLLTQLVELFFNGQGNTDRFSFHAYVAQLRELLPPTIQNQLIELADSAISREPVHYLTLLIKAVQHIPNAAVKPLLPP